MNMPIFVSHPSAINKDQQHTFDFIKSELEEQHLEARALGQSDYPTLLPLREVLSITKHCVGGLILGFRQFETESGIWKKGTGKERQQDRLIAFPTPWNQLEAGIMYSLGFPLLIFREEGVEGGIFDIGTSDIFIHNLPIGQIGDKEKYGIREVFIRWSAQVRQYYYRDNRL